MTTRNKGTAAAAAAAAAADTQSTSGKWTMAQIVGITNNLLDSVRAFNSVRLIGARDTSGMNPLTAHANSAWQGFAGLLDRYSKIRSITLACDDGLADPVSHTPAQIAEMLAKGNNNLRVHKAFNSADDCKRAIAERRAAIRKA